MCGIVGFVEKKENIKTLRNMLQIISHRGPDDNGFYLDKKTGIHLGHVRLSIIDLSDAGHQPMVSSCGNYVIVYNGEVYNFREIRKELEKYGYRFKSNTDTEVILNAFIHWGANAINKFIGMFAFAIFDKKNRKLFLVRDRAGVKPLYYYLDKEFFMFASEIKAFHKHRNFKKKLNYKVLPFYFQFGYIPSFYTIFKNCYKLEAGHYLEYDLITNKFKIHKYWDIEDSYLMDKIEDEEEKVLEKLEDILTDAIQLRLIADVPVGVFLSGGYDSSFISAILSKKLGLKINTFTIGFKEKIYNEAKHAKDIAKYLGTNHTEYYMEEKDFFELIENLPLFYDEPFGDSSALPSIIVSRMARKDVKVVLSGDGGDETFIGYSKYFALYKLHRINPIFKLFLKIITYFPDLFERFNEILPKYLKQSNIKERLIKLRRALNGKSIEEKFINASSYVNPKDVKMFLKVYETEIIEKLFKNRYNLNILEYMLVKDYKLFMKDDVLVKVDRATMGVSLEGREPLLDHRIIEYVARIPINIKYKNGINKYLLRKILYKYIPQSLIDKPKTGFQIPLDKWLKGSLGYLIDKYLNKDKLDNEIFNIKEVKNTLNNFLHKGGSPYKIWFILVFQMWKERWFD